MKAALLAITIISLSYADNIFIEQFEGATQWFYQAYVLQLSSGNVISKFEVQLSDDSWRECIEFQYWSMSSPAYRCDQLSDALSLPFSVRLTADPGSNEETGTEIITSFSAGQEFDFGTNFAVSPTPAPVPAPTCAPSAPGNNMIIHNDGTGTPWYYKANVYSITAGHEISHFKIKLSDGSWHDCDKKQWWSESPVFYACDLIPAGKTISLPFSVRLKNTETPPQILESTCDIVTSFDDGELFDFRQNFV